MEGARTQTAGVRFKHDVREIEQNYVDRRLEIIFRIRAVFQSCKEGMSLQ